MGYVECEVLVIQYSVCSHCQIFPADVAANTLVFSPGYWMCFMVSCSRLTLERRWVNQVSVGFKNIWTHRTVVGDRSVSLGEWPLERAPLLCFFSSLWRSPKGRFWLIGWICPRLDSWVFVVNWVSFQFPLTMNKCRLSSWQSYLVISFTLTKHSIGILHSVVAKVAHSLVFVRPTRCHWWRGFGQHVDCDCLIFMLSFTSVWLHYLQ